MYASAASRLLAVPVALLALGACAAPRSQAPEPALAAQAVADAATPATPRPELATSDPTPTQEPAAQRDAATAKVATPAPARPARRLPFAAERAGLAVAKPRGWDIKRRDGALVYEAPLRVPSIVFFQPQGDSLDDVVGGLAQELSAPLGRVRITRAAQQTKLAGYPAYVAEGTGSAEGFPMRWRATVVDAKELTVVLALAPSFFWGPNVRSIRAFEQGIRRTDGAAAALPVQRVAQR